MEKEKGWVRLYRKIWDSEIMQKPPEWGLIWIWLFSNVNWQDSSICKRGSGVFSYQQIAKTLKVSPSTVDHCVRWLKLSGNIATQQRFRKVIISIVNFETYQAIEDDQKRSVSDLSANHRRSIGDLSANLYYKKEELRIKNKNKTYGHLYDDRFQKFWESYPKKKAKKAAAKALMKIDPDGERMEQILRAIERDKKSEDWVKDGGQYIPHAASWLNGERWLDEDYEEKSFFQRCLEVSDATAERNFHSGDGKTLQSLREESGREASE